MKREGVPLHKYNISQLISQFIRFYRSPLRIQNNSHSAIKPLLVCVFLFSFFLAPHIVSQFISQYKRRCQSRYKFMFYCSVLSLCLAACNDHRQPDGNVDEHSFFKCNVLCLATCNDNRQPDGNVDEHSFAYCSVLCLVTYNEHRQRGANIDEHSFFIAVCYAS